MEKVYGKSPTFFDGPTPYCAGCYHGLIQKCCIEVVDELDIRQRFVYGGAVGCNGMGSFIINADAWGTCHGRAPCVATAFKKLHPENCLLVYQGDGDACSIGLGDTLHAANRGEAFTVVMGNNSLYGMTGGQASPTTPTGMRTTTTREGNTNHPMRLAEMIATLDAPALVARCSVHDPKHIIEFKNLLKKALKLQMEKGVYSYIEVLGVCPTGSHIDPANSANVIREQMIPVFPLGVLKDISDRL